MKDSGGIGRGSRAPLKRPKKSPESFSFAVEGFPGRILSGGKSKRQAAKFRKFSLRLHETCYDLCTTFLGRNL